MKKDFLTRFQVGEDLENKGRWGFLKLSGW